VKVLVNHVRPVEAGIDQRMRLERLDARLHEERHEAERGAVRLLELVLVLGPQRVDGRQVGLVVGLAGVIFRKPYCVQMK